MYNKAILIGRIGKDPEYNQTPTGTAIAKTSLATSETYNGEDKTTWHNLVIFGKMAENFSKYAGKGRLVYVEGKIDISKYEKDGIEKVGVNVVVSSFKLLGRRDEEKTTSNGQEQVPNLDDLF